MSKGQLAKDVSPMTPMALHPDALKAWRASVTAPPTVDPVAAVKPKNTASDIYLYGVIGWDNTAEQFVEQLKGVDAETVVLHINSPGGDVFDGVAIYNTIRQHKAKFEARIEGMAASAASFLVMACDTISIAQNAQLMIHKSWGVCIGNADDTRKFAAELDKIDGTIAHTYTRRAGGTDEAWLQAMADETWYTGAEAVAAKLADALLDPDDDEEPASKAQQMAEQMVNTTLFKYRSRAEAPTPYIPGEDDPQPETDVTADADTEPAPTGEANTKWQDHRDLVVAALIGR